MQLSPLKRIYKQFSHDQTTISIFMKIIVKSVEIDTWHMEKSPPLPSQTQYTYMQPRFPKIKIRSENIPNDIQNSLIYSVPDLLFILYSSVVDKEFQATG